MFRLCKQPYSQGRVLLKYWTFGGVVLTYWRALSPCYIFRAEKFRFKVNMYRLKEEREIEPRTLAHLVSSTLYERR